MAQEVDAWVTTCVDDVEVTPTLILARSLRLSMTTKKLVLVASPQLSSKSRSVLSEHFDQLLYFDQHSVNGWIGLKDYAKLYCFNLTLFRKCCFVSGGVVMVKNCDELFDLGKDNEFMAKVMRSHSGQILDVDTAVFCFTPSVKLFDQLVASGKRNSKKQVAPFQVYMKDWLLNQRNFKELDEKFNFLLKTNSVATKEFAIARLPENLISTGFDDLKFDGILESATMKLWKMLESEEATTELNVLTPNSNSNNLLDSIAIVGLSCRHAGAQNASEFWELLEQGLSGIRQVPSDRWTKEHGCKTSLNLDATTGGFLSQPIDEFDGKLFGISPKEIELLDPQQRLLLETAWEALENASIDPLKLQRSHTGVFLGAWMNDYKDILRENGSDDFYRIYMGNSFGAAAARLSFCLGLTGPSVATESGCSSSLVAVDMAVKSLRNGETHLALACGVNLLASPYNKDTMSFVIASDGQCKTFDESADGFGRAEGCGVLVLKRYQDAVKDGDNICALIRGSSCVQEGISRSMGTPTKDVEALAMSLALKDARVDPLDVSFIETHGTGTPVGDPLEVSAISEVYGSQERKQPLIIGSVKTNIGHTESCSGITGIIKVILSMKHELIPKHLNLTKLNPKINLESIPAKIPLEALEWPKVSGKPRLAGVSSFGITGTDGHLILQEPPQRQRSSFLDFNDALDERPLHLLKLSAKTPEALDKIIQDYQKVVSGENSGISFPDLCYTANTGRATLAHRIAVVAKDSIECGKLLQSRKYLRGEAPDITSKICFLFTGQGSQYEGMAQELYGASPVFRMHFDKCTKILEKYEINVKEAMWGSFPEMNRTLFSQTSIFCVEYALLKLWESWGVKADFVLGHSLGEFCAAVAAKHLTLEEALLLVAERSKLVDALPRGSMVVVKASKREVDSALKDFPRGTLLDFAAVNSPEQTVLAGEDQVVQEFSEFCSGRNLKTHVLDSSHAFHSRMMDPILPNYKNVATCLKGKWRGRGSAATPKYISGVYGRLFEDEEAEEILTSSQYWVDHTREKVDFIGASKALVSEGCKVFLEIGPHPVLSALIMQNLEGSREGIYLPSLRRNEGNWKTILGSLSKLFVSGWNINWMNFDALCSRKKVADLPTYPFQRKKYWFDVNSCGTSGYFNSWTQIHPLLGSVFPNASAAKIFQSGVDTRKRLEWIKDHTVGRRVIFPGAGYLEMCLSAGHCATEGMAEEILPKPSGPLTLENLKIIKPLALEDKSVCQLQTVVHDGKEGSSGGVNVKVYRQLKMDGEAPKWVEHCSTSFTPAAVEFDELEFREKFNFQEVSATCETPVEMGDFYSKLAGVGLNFGPHFQSLQKLWKGPKGILGEVKAPQDWKSYIVHPVLLDAMLQAGMILWGKGALEKLHVPIGIKKFTWLQHDIKEDGTDNFLVYSCFQEPAGDEPRKVISVLFDGHNGKAICYMEGMDFLETSVEALELSLESQESSIPALHCEVWKPQRGPHQDRVDIWSLFKEQMFDPADVRELFKDSNLVEERILEREPVYEALVYGYALKAFYDLGWNAKVGDRFTLESFLFDLHITSQHKKLIRYQMTMLEREGIAKFTSDSELEVIKNPPSPREVSELIRSARIRLQSFDNVEISVQIYTSCGQNLASILQGKSSALSILFPQDPSRPSAESFYTEAYSYSGIDVKTKENFKLLLHPIESNSKGILRILEVGAGTGNFTGGILNMLREQGIQVEYTFTDISSAFFISASKKFEELKDSIKYRVFNVEDDAKSQGFSPGYYDVVFAADVIHATKDISDSLQNLRQLLKPEGFLCLIEGARQNHITCIFGLLDGYWRFTDTEVRQHHPLIPGEKWEELCLKKGFDRAVSIACSANFYTFVLARAAKEEVVSRGITYSPGGRWLVFPNVEDVSKDVVKRLGLYRDTVTVWRSMTFQEREDGCAFGVNPGNKEHFVKLFNSVKKGGGSIEGIVYLWGISVGHGEDQSDISQPFLYLCQAVVEMKQQPLPKLFVVTKGVYSIGDHLCTDPGSSTVWAIAKSCSNEMNMKIKLIDLCPEGEMNSEDLFYELWNDTSDLSIAYRAKTRYFGRLIKTKLLEKRLKFPQSPRYHLILPKSKAIADLKFGTLGHYSLKPDEIEVEVKAAALNFRDVFAVMKPDPQFDNINVVGSDFAGVVTGIGSNVTKWKVGHPVFGCNLENGALPSHVRIVESAVVRVPDEFTFPEAATLPAVFGTAYYSLITVAKMKEGDVVLVHTASGGVGLSAIQICQGVGATVIATAGSARKRAYLRSLGVRHVFHSRNTNYKKDILKVTGGKGVDIVLNSLTSKGFKEASLALCKVGARFVEMSKLSIWTNEEVKELRPDVEYTIVDLTSVSREVWTELFETLDVYLKKKTVKPIPYVRFDGAHIREALTYLQKAKHIGKIVCVMPEVTFSSGQYVHETPLFNSKSTYLITGGLGGIGFEVMKWMVAQGAKTVVIVSRSQPKEKHMQVIKQFRAQGLNIITKAVDVGDFTMCKKLIAEIVSMNYPLRGVMHCAGVLQDATLINQNWEKFQQAYRPKVKGAWNLHSLTKDLPLEHFVMFSSMAALFGPPGQSNHAAGNAYLDALAWYRETIGLPSLSVNWGQWGQVGVAAGREVRGVHAFSPQRGIAALEAILKSQRTQVCVVDLELQVLLKVQPMSKAYLQDMVGSSGGSNDPSGISIKSETFWEEVDAAKDEDKPGVIKDYVKVLLRQILKLDEEEPIDDHSNFQDIGLDSLMMIELKNNLQSILGSRMTIGASALSDCHNIDLLTQKLLQQMDESSSSSPSSLERKLSSGELRRLVEEDSKLPDDITATGPPALNLPSCKVFLLTGVTGNLGPHILKELLHHHQPLEKIYCLMRKSANPMQRLNQNLKETLVDPIDMSKISTIFGDLCNDHLGMPLEVYQKLCEEVDVVIHCAVKSNHVEYYGLSGMRQMNVHGTRRILKFCCEGKTKYLLHASSIVAVSSTDDAGCLSQQWPEADELEGVTDLGYPISKMIGDRLVHQAVERGVPAKVFRFAGLIGHSGTGRFKHWNNHIMLRFLCYMKLGAMPSVPVPAFLLPVDLAASTAIKIFFHGTENPEFQFDSDIYNLCHPNPSLEQEFPMIAQEFGYDVDVVEYTEFVNRFASEGEDSLLYPFRELYENEERYNSLATFPDAIRKWLENPDRFFNVQKVSELCPEFVQSLEETWEYVKRDLMFAKKTGLFEKFKLSK